MPTEQQPPSGEGMAAVLEAARRLVEATDFRYSDREDDYAQMVCVACGADDWGQDEHEKDCPVVALRSVPWQQQPTPGRAMESEGWKLTPRRSYGRPRLSALAATSRSILQAGQPAPSAVKRPAERWRARVRASSSRSRWSRLSGNLYLVVTEKWYNHCDEALTAIPALSGLSTPAVRSRRCVHILHQALMMRASFDVLPARRGKIPGRSMRTRLRGLGYRAVARHATRFMFAAQNAALSNAVTPASGISQR
jgi:hypothetical protein